MILDYLSVAWVIKDVVYLSQIVEVAAGGVFFKEGCGYYRLKSRRRHAEGAELLLSHMNQLILIIVSEYAEALIYGKCLDINILRNLKMPKKTFC